MPKPLLLGGLQVAHAVKWFQENMLPDGKVFRLNILESVQSYIRGAACSREFPLK